MWETYQHLPEMINPIAFSIGFFPVRWYSIMYLAGFATVYFLLAYRIKKEEINFVPKNILQDLTLYLAAGLIIGARFGYVLFYNFSYYLQNPWEIISPFSDAGITGISGMSYHGGLIGAIIAGIIFVNRRKLNPHTKGQDKNINNNSLSANHNKKSFGVGVNFWKLADFLASAIPAGYFFGRVGNFLNGELYGRATDMPWGMYFTDGILRHPSQLYEAFFEGLVLFLVLWTLRNGIKYRNKMFHVSCFMLYVVGYSFFRFFIEFFREPDPQIGLVAGYLTMGQVLSIIMLISAIFCYFIVKKGKIVYTGD